MKPSFSKRALPQGGILQLVQVLRQEATEAVTASRLDLAIATAAAAFAVKVHLGIRPILEFVKVAILPLQLFHLLMSLLLLKPLLMPLLRASEATRLFSLPPTSFLPRAVRQHSQQQQLHQLLQKQQLQQRQTAGFGLINDVQ